MGWWGMNGCGGASQHIVIRTLKHTPNTVHSTQHTAHSIQHTAYNTQHTHAYTHTALSTYAAYTHTARTLAMPGQGSSLVPSLLLQVSLSTVVSARWFSHPYAEKLVAKSWCYVKVFGGCI